MASEKYVNNAVTTLNGAINNSTTTVIVTSAALFPATGQFRILVGTGAGAEIMLVTSVSSNTFTVATRGTIDDSAAQSHSDLDAVSQVLTKGALNQIIADNCQYGACGSLPSAEKAGRLYFGSDYPMVYRDTGSAWQAYNRGAPVNPPVTSGYTWSHASGGPTATNTDITNGPSILSHTAIGTGDKFSAFTKSLPATPCSVVARFILNSNAGTASCGVCMSDGTKYYFIGPMIESNITRVWSVKYSALNTYSGEYITRQDFPVNYGDMYMKITDDGTNRDSFFSNDGNSWQRFHTIGRTDFLTATTGGVFIGSNSFSGNPVTMIWISEG